MTLKQLHILVNKANNNFKLTKFIFVIEVSIVNKQLLSEFWDVQELLELPNTKKLFNLLCTQIINMRSAY